MTSRLSRPLGLLLLAALTLAACVPSMATPAVTSGLTATPSTILAPTATLVAPISVAPSALRGLHIQVWHAFSGSAADVFTTQLAMFNTVNEWGIVAYQTPQGDYPSLFDAVNTALGSDTQPDLVAAPPEQVLAWDASGAVVDLNPYVGDQNWGLGSDAIADFPAAFWAQDLVNGKRLGVPSQRSARFLFYNVTWAHELGFDQPPATADEFRQQVCAANASFRKDTDPTNDGYGGWIVDTDWMTVYPWLLAFGGGVTEGGGYRFASDANLAALNFMKDLYDKNCAFLSTEPTPYESFARRSALFVTGDLSEAATLTATMTRLKSTDAWTVLPFPGSDGSAVIAYGPSYTLLKSTPAKQLAAWLFVRWMLSPENQAQWVKATGDLPLRTSALDLLAEYRAAHPQWVAAVGYLSQFQGTPQLASWRKVRYVLGDATGFIFRTPVKLAQIPNVLADMDATAEELSK
jgi:multiple sugar transport system substrate-binding protein